MKSFEDCNTVKLYQKGCVIINHASVKSGDSVEVMEGDKVLKNAGGHTQANIVC